MITEELKQLLDGNRWMPLLARDSLIKAGVPSADVLTEVMHSEDEIDVLVFYQNRVLVVELKNRPVNLNDAYKLSAKTSRLENVGSKTDPPFWYDPYNPYADERREYRAGFVRTGTSGPRELLQKPAAPEGSFIPVVITTHEIARDAINLLRETKENVEFLEHAEGKMDYFLQQVIKSIADDLFRRFKALVSAKPDSIARLASQQIDDAFGLWYDAQPRDTVT